MRTPCVVTSRSASEDTDELGNEKPGESSVETVCYVEQKRRDEDERGGEVSQTEWLGLFPTGTALDTAAAVWVEDLGTFELVGAPWPVKNPRTQVVSHLEATLSRIAGAHDEEEPS